MPRQLTCSVLHPTSRPRVGLEFGRRIGRGLGRRMVLVLQLSEFELHEGGSEAGSEAEMREFGAGKREFEVEMGEFEAEPHDSQPELDEFQPDLDAAQCELR